MITFAMFVGRLRNFVTHTAINFWMWPTTSMFTLTSLGWARDQQLPCSLLLRWGEHVTNNFHVHSYFVGVSTWPTTSMFILTSLGWARDCTVDAPLSHSLITATTFLSVLLLGSRFKKIPLVDFGLPDVHVFIITTYKWIYYQKFRGHFTALSLKCSVAHWRSFFLEKGWVD